MFYFGQKRHRPIRTLSVRGPETRRAWLWSRMKNRSLMGRLGLCLLAVVVMLVAVPSWRVPFPYRQGQRVPNGVAAAIDFEVVNQQRTESLRRDAEAEAPLVFRHDPTILDILPGDFKRALDAVEQAEKPEDLDIGVRRDFGLNAVGLNAVDPKAPPGFQSPEERFQKLKDAVSPLQDPNGQTTAQDRINTLASDFTYFIAPLRESGVISRADITTREIDVYSRLKIIPTGEKKPAGENKPATDAGKKVEAPATTAAAAPDDSAGYQSLKDVSLQILLGDTGELASKWTSNPTLGPIKPLVSTWLQQHCPPTLRYDQTATNEAKTKAREAVDDFMNLYPQGEMIVRPGTILNDEHLATLGAEYDRLRAQASWSDISLRVLVVFVMLLALAVLNGYYLYRNEPDVVHSFGRLTVYLTAIVAAVALGRLLSFDPWRAEVIPLVATVMIFAIAYNQVFAALTGFTLCLIVTLSTTAQLSQFVVLMTTTATAVALLSRMSSRTTLIKAGFLAGVAYLVVSLSVAILESQNAAQLFSDFGMLKRSLIGAAYCLLAGYLVAGSLPFIESTFGVITDISLLEMSDPSHPLLQELVRRAPGTYNHSISVASIGESAAETIGANGLLVRVGAYFHDVGKMLKPHYFIENVHVGGQSRHEHLAPAMSTLIIIGHVKDGVDLAEQYNLPHQLIDFIEQHHGTTLVEYFYQEATRKAEESEDHKTDAEESSFRYPGPKPQTKEAGVMMLADAVESASRALTDPTAKRLETLVHDLTMKRLLDGQFDECTLTLSELRTIETSLVKSLIGIYHGRIKYPEARTA
jgi:putative nucleotidyltransferase with HDIG domain